MATTAGLNEGDERLVFESSEAISVVPTFDQLGLKEDLLRGIYAYSQCFIFFSHFYCTYLITGFRRF